MVQVSCDQCSMELKFGGRPSSNVRLFAHLLKDLQSPSSWLCLSLHYRAADLRTGSLAKEDGLVESGLFLLSLLNCPPVGAPWQCIYNSCGLRCDSGYLICPWSCDHRDVTTSNHPCDCIDANPKRGETFLPVSALLSTCLVKGRHQAHTFMLTDRHRISLSHSLVR